MSNVNGLFSLSAETTYEQVRTFEGNFLIDALKTDNRLYFQTLETIITAPDNKKITDVYFCCHIDIVNEYHKDDVSYLINDPQFMKLPNRHELNIELL